MAFDPLTALAVIQGIDTGVGLIKGRQQKSAGETQQALQNVLQTLSPQTQGQQPVRQGQGQDGSFLSDPLVQKVVQEMIGKFMKSGQPVSKARASLPDPRQGLQGSVSAAGSALANSALGATAWVWPDGRPVTPQEANDPSIPMAVRQTWIRKNPLPYGPSKGIAGLTS